MLPPVTAMLVSSAGTLRVIVVTAGTVPATAHFLGGFALAPTGELYVVVI